MDDETQEVNKNKRWSVVNGRWPVVIVLLLALGLRLALWSQPLHQPANDEVEYITVARDLLAGRGWEFYDSYHWLRAPLYTLWLAGSLWLAQGNLYLAALPNILLSVATVYLIYLLTTEIVKALQTTDDGRRTTDDGPRYSALSTQPSALIPLIAALLAALLFTFNTFASLYMSETLFSFLLTASLLLLVRWRRRMSTRPPTADRRRLMIDHGHLLVAGVLFGLAALTRSLPLAFLPIIGFWILDFGLGIFYPRSKSHQSPIQSLPSNAVKGLKSKIGNAFIFIAFVALTIAPWTIRNCWAYDRCILVETGLSYNLWAFNEPREDTQTIFRTLEQIPNPAERADEATRRGIERLQEDPAILLRKLWPNWVHLWRVKVIQDRFLLADYSSDPPPLVFLSSLILDDGLYLLILATSVFGMSWAFVRDWRGTVLFALWVVYVVGMTMVTHGEARYRHFLFPVLMPYAALTITGVTFRLRDRGKWLPVAYGSAALITGLLLYTVAISYPWQWAQDGAARSVHRMRGDIALARGNLTAATSAYERALQADSTPDGWIALGDVRRQQDDLAGAETAYRRAWRRELDHIPASARLGDLLRAQGETNAARTAFTGRYVTEKDVLDWSWANLDPPPVSQIDVGNGLDFGYVGGMHSAEPQQGATARWTDGRGTVRVVVPTPTQAEPGQPAFIRMRLAAPQPGREQVTAQLCTANLCQPLPIGRNWQVTAMRLPVATTASQVVELHSPTFTAADGRQLGVLIDWLVVDRGVVTD